MINKLNFEGYVERIIFKNDKVVKFAVINKGKQKDRKVTATLFNSYGLAEQFNSVENLVGRIVVVEGEIYESNYKDKQTNEWINTYCIQVSKVEDKYAQSLEVNQGEGELGWTLNHLRN